MNNIEIKKQRKKLGLTQSELAEIIGVSENTVYNYERGTKIPLSKITILRRVFYDKTPTDYTTEEEKLPVVNENLIKEYEIAKNTWKKMIFDITNIIKEIEKEPNTIDKIKHLREANLTKSKLLQDLEDLKR